MSIDQAIAILEDNIEEADFCGGVELNKIKEAEKILSITFPESYRFFLNRYGAGDIAGIEIFGIINDPHTDKDTIPNGIWLTLHLRNEYNLSPSCIVVSETGYGPYYIIDTSEVDKKNESPVYLWDVSNKKEKVADDFGIFFYDLLKESV